MVRVQRVLARDARTNRRRALVFTAGLAVGIAGAPFLTSLYPDIPPYLAVYTGLLAGMLLVVTGNLDPYEESFDEFLETYINAYHNLLWPLYVVHLWSKKIGLTNFMLVEGAAVLCSGVLAALTAGQFDICCSLLCFGACFASWFCAPVLKLTWY